MKVQAIQTQHNMDLILNFRKHNHIQNQNMKQTVLNGSGFLKRTITWQFPIQYRVRWQHSLKFAFQVGSYLLHEENPRKKIDRRTWFQNKHVLFHNSLPPIRQPSLFIFPRKSRLRELWVQLWNWCPQWAQRSSSSRTQRSPLFLCDSSSLYAIAVRLFLHAFAVLSMPL